MIVTIFLALLAGIVLMAALLFAARLLTDRKSSAELGRARGDASEINGGCKPAYNPAVGAEGGEQ